MEVLSDFLLPRLFVFLEVIFHSFQMPSDMLRRLGNSSEIQQLQLIVSELQALLDVVW